MTLASRFILLVILLHAVGGCTENPGRTLSDAARVDQPPVEEPGIVQNKPQHDGPDPSRYYGESVPGPILMSDTEALHIADKCADLTIPCSWAQLCRELGVDLIANTGGIVDNMKVYNYSRLSEHCAIVIEVPLFEPQRLQTDRDKVITGAAVINYHVIGRPKSPNFLGFGVSEDRA